MPLYARSWSASSGDACGSVQGWRARLIYIIDLNQSADASLIGVDYTLPGGGKSMSESGVAVAQLGGWRAVSRYQWLVFAVVWAGWTLDAADFGLYSLVLRPALIDLLGGNPPLTDIGKYRGLLAVSGLFGCALRGR